MPQTRRKSINANLPHAPGQLPGQKIGKKRSSLAPAHKQNAKMDVARAMGIMGFNSSRWLECSQVLKKLVLNIFWVMKIQLPMYIKNYNSIAI